MIYVDRTGTVSPRVVLSTRSPLMPAIETNANG